MFCLWFSEQILPGVRIIIANPETKGPMGESHLGEVCLSLNYKSLVTWNKSTAGRFNTNRAPIRSCLEEILHFPV